ncbi:phosphate ABC transporter substrate-binding protein PstS [Streptoalloteichus hindustanus]|uniref:Phosphate-binding protein n=1 Tax=Streptoalloteichus hindustanus TaxID=2017 RepID=A0A1M4U6Z1_STRHI|nr:phosphate ABC transporter substrate-binding protein PstS [Streptoalloteichus hindustanus]SHE52455.1 phosphate ABC transporter substrate-binding protein, PhoT family [Streptoalloteichus hindustanus]
MNIKRHGAALGLAAASALLLSACGSDNNAPAQSGSGAASGVNVDCGGKKQLTGEGSSAQTNAIQEFVAAYAAKCQGFDVAYNPTGSGNGIKQFTSKQVDFGGTDSPLKDDEVAKAAERCQSNPAWHLPLVFGPVAVAYNLPGVDGLVLNPETTAKIFNGQVKKWNDPAIKALNGSANLPDKDIVVFFRSDESGTTDNFQKYLQASAKSAWTQGGGKQFKGGVGEGKAKSQGVSDGVKATEGAITYVESSFAKSAKLGVAKIDSGAGPVELTDATAGKAIASAKIKGQGNDMVIDLDALYASKEAGAYPLVLVTYELVCSKGYDADTTKAVKAFLGTAAGPGQDNLTKVGYVPLPKEFRTKLQDAVKAIA